MKKRDRTEYLKSYREANKDKVGALCKAWRDANKVKTKEYNKAYQKSLKHSPLVYLLPKENYIGTTSVISRRISEHKSLGRNTDNYKILKRFETRADALELERKMHDIGYKGKHTNNSYK